MKPAWRKKSSLKRPEYFAKESLPGTWAVNKMRFEYPIIVLTRVLKVSRDGYYAWRSRRPSRRTRTDERLKPLIRGLHVRFRATYGSKRLQDGLTEHAVFIGRDRISRLRKEMGLRCKQKRKLKVTTNSAHTLPVAPNLLD